MAALRRGLIGSTAVTSKPQAVNSREMRPSPQPTSNALPFPRPMKAASEAPIGPKCIMVWLTRPRHPLLGDLGPMFVVLTCSVHQRVSRRCCQNQLERLERALLTKSDDEARLF